MIWLRKVLGVVRCTMCKIHVSESALACLVGLARRGRILITALVTDDDKGNTTVQPMLFSMCDACYRWCVCNKDAASAILKSKVLNG